MRRNMNGILSAVLLFVILLQGMQVFFPSLSKWLFIYLPLTGATVIIAIVLLFFTIPHIWKSSKEGGFKKVLPLTLNLILLACIFLNPLHPAFQAAEFSLKYQDRMEAVSLFHEKKLEQSREGKGLYKVDSSLSDGSEISESGENVLFYTNRGIIDNFAGYIYSPDGDPPTEDEMEAEIIQIRQLNENWYYVACT